MASFPAAHDAYGNVNGVSQFSEAPQIWESLKCAIAASSGFQRWQLECLMDAQLQQLTLDHQVCQYLHETLDSLAY